MLALWHLHRAKLELCRQITYWCQKMEISWILQKKERCYQRITFSYQMTSYSTIENLKISTMCYHNLEVCHLLSLHLSTTLVHSSIKSSSWVILSQNSFLLRSNLRNHVLPVNMIMELLISMFSKERGRWNEFISASKISSVISNKSYVSTYAANIMWIGNFTWQNQKSSIR